MSDENLVKCCASCKWRSDDFSSVCVNDASDSLADFVSTDDYCDCWEGRKDEHED